MGLGLKAWNFLELWELLLVFRIEIARFQIPKPEFVDFFDQLENFRLPKWLWLYYRKNGNYKWLSRKKRSVNLK